MLSIALRSGLRRIRGWLAEFPPAWFFGLVTLAVLGLAGLFILFSRTAPLQVGTQTGLLVGATVGFLIGLVGLPTGLLAASLLRFGVSRSVISYAMARVAVLGSRVLVFSVAVLAGLLLAGGSDPVSFPWLLIGLALGMLVGLLGVLYPVFSLSALLGIVLGIPLAMALDRYVGDGQDRRRPFWAGRQRLANRFWRPKDDDILEPIQTEGSESVVFIAPDPLRAAPAMLDFIDKGYQVSYETPERVLNSDRLPKNPRLFVGSRSVLGPWMLRGGRPSTAGLTASKLVAGLHATYPRARFLIVEDDEIAHSLGAPLVTHHAHASIDDGPNLLVGARTALGPRAPVRKLWLLDWLERHLLPEGTQLPTSPETRLMQAGILQSSEEIPTKAVHVLRNDDISLDGLAVAIYEVDSWDGWDDAEARIRADRAGSAILHGPHDMQDGGWMVYVDGENRGEVGSLALARGLLADIRSNDTPTP